MHLTFRYPVFVCIALFAVVARAEFPKPFDTEKEPIPPPQPAETVAAEMTLPKGMKATVFAAEPDVCNPIAVAWDHRGRLWVAENYTYAEAPKKLETSLRDRVIVLGDKDGDGKHDERTVFFDDLVNLTGIEVGRGGVWLMCPPQVLFIPDRNHDDVPDGKPEVVLDGFTPPQENHHNFANGLRFGPDGWLYGRCGASGPGHVGVPGTPEAERVPIRGGMWRYSPRTGVYESLNSGTTNPWGHDWDRNGELFFINTVNGHLWHGITGAHFTRPHTLDPNPRVYELIDTHADHWHFDTEAGWAKSRDGVANKLGGGHAHIGCMIYQGTDWPGGYRDRLFTLNMHGRRANRERLDREGSGYVGKHEPDMFIVNDPWFRGMELTAGPDGAVYVADWCDAGECHERTGVHRSSGRIYRIAMDPAQKNPALRKPTVIPDFMKMPLLDLVEQTAAGEWFARQARLVLTERTDDYKFLHDFVSRYSANTAAGREPATTLHRLWAANTLGKIDPALLLDCLKHDDEFIRTWGVRLLSDDWPLDTPLSARPAHAATSPPPDSRAMGEFMRLAKTDPSPVVRLVLATVLQRLPVANRLPLATALAAHEEDAADHNLPLMIWYGLIPVAEEQGSQLATLAAACKLPTTRKLIARRLAEDVEKKPAPFNELLTKVSVSKDFALIDDVIHGATQALAGWHKAPKPAAWDKFAAKAATSTDKEVPDLVRELSVLFGDGRALDAVKAIALDNDADMQSRKAALQTLLDNRPDNLRAICERTIKTRFLNPIAARGLALYDDPAVAELLVTSYGSFHPSEKPQLIAVLASRPSFAKALLTAVEANKIPRAQLTAFDARQIHGFNKPELNELLSRTWGEFRDSSEEKKSLIAALKAQLTATNIASADKSNGRFLFNKSCAACHKFFGEGQTVGPDLTGANRDNLDYLLENMIDPSAVVSADFRMSVLELSDGRVLNGLVLAETEKTLTLRTATETVVVNRDDVDQRKIVPLSLMPENQLQPLTDAERRDLIAYLQTRNQVPLPEEKK